MATSRAVSSQARRRRANGPAPVSPRGWCATRSASRTPPISSPIWLRRWRRCDVTAAHEQAVLAAIDEAELVRLASELVAIPSVSTEESEAQCFVAEHL